MCRQERLWHERLVDPGRREPRSSAGWATRRQRRADGRASAPDRVAAALVAPPPATSASPATADRVAAVAPAAGRAWRPKATRRG